jgi:signal transduction histidine kinase
MSLLIVDDSVDQRLLLKTVLNAAGYAELITAESARDAFKHLRMDETQGVEVGIDLILLDITMPEMDGIEACRQIKAVRHVRDIPIVMVTAHTEVSELESAFAPGAIDYITKPINKVELLSRVRSALTLKQETDDRKLAYIQLAEKNKELEEESLAKTQILSTVTHELKTPLSSITGYIDRMLLRRDRVGPLNERQERYLETVQRNGRRLKALIDDLLDVSRIESGSLDLNLVELDVQREIEEVACSLQDQINEKRQHLVLNISTNLPRLKADELRFSQILTNLLSNACKYSPEGATTTITAEEQDGLMRIDVSDTGVGISEADRSRLFSKFFRVDNSSTSQVSGTGLGLFITKSIIEAHGGLIQVRGDERKGTTFSFTLPIENSGDVVRDTGVSAESAVNA